MVVAVIPPEQGIVLNMLAKCGADTSQAR
jgi:hypothetical protein